MQILTISMMVAGFVGLLAVAAGAAVLGSLLIVLLRESRKLDGYAGQAAKVAALTADVAALAKNVNLIEELVHTKLNRIATTSKRARKALEADEEASKDDAQGILSGVEFPSLQ